MELSEIKGVGKKTLSLLKKLKIETVDDLLMHYPRKYEEYPKPVPIGSLSEGRAAIMCRVSKQPVVGKNGLTTLYVSDGTGSISCKWFHNPYIGRMLDFGRIYVFHGNVSDYGGKKYLMQPTFEKAEEYVAKIGSYTPVYPLTAGLSNENLFKMVLQAISMMPEPIDALPEDIRIRYQLISKGDAMRCIHYPGNFSALQMARRRLIFEEFYNLLYGLHERAVNRGKNHFRIYGSETAESIVGSLPYKLTASQEKAFADIKEDFEKELVADRLVQGDVGSGKTLVAFLAMVTMADNGFQSVLMAPTEVLAAQHYKELCALLEKAGKMEEFAPVLLTGSVKEKDKVAVRSQIAAGKSRIVIGTHAVIQEKVEYRDLALAVIDEQHRFGVEQREKLSGKGGRPVHTIIMTATPIPRTTGNIIFGGMDLSVMTEKPAGRKPIINYAVPQGSSLCRELVAKELSAGHQAYVICPAVEGDSDGRRSVGECAQKLRRVFPGAEVGELHGRMDPKKKESAMACFANGETKILVSTTVIEVGIDVPNATIIVIEGANNFGMLQLHQIRGRVGRSDAQSYCIFVNASEEPNEKLDIMARTNDGFEIAEADYRIRKAGSLLGTQQSGDMGFRLADIIRDEPILKEAEEAVRWKMGREKKEP